jgi:hypothetical protein
MESSRKYKRRNPSSSVSDTTKKQRQIKLDINHPLMKNALEQVIRDYIEIDGNDGRNVMMVCRNWRDTAIRVTDPSINKNKMILDAMRLKWVDRVRFLLCNFPKVYHSVSIELLSQHATIESDMKNYIIYNEWSHLCVEILLDEGAMKLKCCDKYCWFVRACEAGNKRLACHLYGKFSDEETPTKEFLLGLLHRLFVSGNEKKEELAIEITYKSPFDKRWESLLELIDGTGEEEQRRILLVACKHDLIYLSKLIAKRITSHESWKWSCSTGVFAEEACKRGHTTILNEIILVGEILPFDLQNCLLLCPNYGILRDVIMTFHTRFTVGSMVYKEMFGTVRIWDMLARIKQQFALDHRMCIELVFHYSLLIDIMDFTIIKFQLKMTHFTWDEKFDSEISEKRFEYINGNNSDVLFF